MEQGGRQEYEQDDLWKYCIKKDVRSMNDSEQG